MGGSGKWLKSLITLRKPNMNDIEKVNDKGKKKWRLWRSSSEGFGSSLKNMKKGHEEVASEKSDSSFLVDEVFIAAVAAVVRAPPKDFILIKKEWAAIRIQAAFRGFLARQALKALKAVVRLQAIFRGRQVRKQAAVTLRCMQALVRVQASVRARSATMSPCRQAAETLLNKHQNESDPLKQAERGWCDIPGTAEEVRAKLHMRQEAAIKREKIMAYSHSQKQSRLSASPKSKTTKGTSFLKHYSHDNSLLDSWIATKPLGNRLLEKMHVGPREMSPVSRKSEDGYCSFYCPNDNYNVSRNNVTTRISANPLLPCQLTPSSSATSSDVMYDDSPASTSYTSASPSMMSSNTPNMQTTEERNIQMPSYMNLTASTKAKKNAYRHSFNLDRGIIEDSHSKSTTLLSGDARSSADSVCSINFRNDLYPSLRTGLKDSVKHQRRHQQK